MQDAISENIFNCRTPSCTGWFLVSDDDNSSQYVCGICKMENCVKCSAIHLFQTCEEFASKTSSTEDSCYKTLVEFEESSDIVPNSDPFDCPICLTSCAIGDGLVLRNCLHVFCFDCIRPYILHSTKVEVEVKCPHVADEFSCGSYLQDREIRSFMCYEEYQKFLNRSLQVAESTIKNSFHCLTADCPGWCIKDGINLVQYDCPVCQRSNCLSCKAIHEGRTCYEYLQSITHHTVAQADSMSQLEIDRLLAEKRAMKCPGCEAIIQKISGCDAMVCSYCHTKFRWVN